MAGKTLVETLYPRRAPKKKATPPSGIPAARHEVSIPLYESFCEKLRRETGLKVLTGEFGADMKVELVNDGPVTICMDTRHKE